MQKTTFGELTETFREQYGFSKTAICRGLCNVSTLYHYENDDFLPDRIVADYLLERLGINPKDCDYMLSPNLVQIYHIRQHITNAALDKNWELISILLEEYKSLDLSNFTFLHEQFIKLYESYILLYKDKNFVKTKDLCLEALAITDCNFNSPKVSVKKIALATVEIELLLNLSYSALELKESEIFSTTYKLKDYLLNLKEANYIHNKYLPYVYYLIAIQQKNMFNLNNAREAVLQAKEILTNTYCIHNLSKVLELQLELENIMHICTDEELEQLKNMILTLKIINTIPNNELITDEGIELWQNSINLK